MLVEITNNQKNVELNKWHLVESIDGIRKYNLYVDFKAAWDKDGNYLPCLITGKDILVELEFLEEDK